MRIDEIKQRSGQRCITIIRDFAFLVDVTEKLNELNVQLQGQDKNFGEMISKVQAFSNKLTFWEHNLSHGDVKHFPCLNEKLEKEINCESYKGENHVQILSSLQKQFDLRFSDFKKLSCLNNLFRLHL